VSSRDDLDADEKIKIPISAGNRTHDVRQVDIHYKE
jgi:hypothetical protein